MKKLLFITLLVVMMLPVLANAAEQKYYLNQAGVEIPYETYQKLCDIYSVGYVEFLTDSEFKNLTENDLNEVIKTEFLESSEPLAKIASSTRGSYFSTNAKSVSLVKNGNYITLFGTWKATPGVKSYDVIAVRFQGVSVAGSYSFKQTYKSGGSYHVIYNGNNKTFSNGGGSSALLQNGTNHEYSLTFRVNGSGTVFGSYQHAVTNVSLNQSKNYTISSNGLGKVIKFAGSLNNYYDGMTGVSIGV